jgi:hypothetical protein
LLEGIERIWQYKPFIGLEFIDLPIAIKKPAALMQSLFSQKEEGMFENVLKAYEHCIKNLKMNESYLRVIYEQTLI